MKEFEETFDDASIAKKKAMIRKSLYKIDVDPNAKKCYFYIFKGPVADELERNLLAQEKHTAGSENKGESCLCSVQGKPSPPVLLSRPKRSFILRT
jgi:hypothetical protein